MKRSNPCAGNRRGIVQAHRAILAIAGLELLSICRAAENDSSTTQQPGASDQGVAGELVRMLAFQRNRVGTSEIGTIDEHGVSIKVLAEGALYFPDRCWSPDGLRIAFVAGPPLINEVYVIDADGTKKTKVTDHQKRSFFCDWSFDGQRVLYVTGNNSEPWKLVELNLATSESRTITENGPNSPCVWSELGDTIVIKYPESTKYEMTPSGESMSVEYFYSKDMTRKITVRTRRNSTSTAYLSMVAGKGDPVVLQLEGMLLRDFSFSGDGERVAFTAARGIRPSDAPDDHEEGKAIHPPGIYVMDSLGQNLRCIVEDGLRATWQPMADTMNAQQGGAGRPATSTESDSEGGDKPQPESEGPSR